METIPLKMPIVSRCFWKSSARKIANTGFWPVGYNGKHRMKKTFAFESWTKSNMPISINVHQGHMDAYQVGRFLKAFLGLMNELINRGISPFTAEHPINSFDVQ